MITAIEIENFKGICERVRIDLKPITLLFGPNSGGKSTILHAIQYAQEVFANHNLNVEKTKSGGGMVDLGGFLNLVHQRKPGRTVHLRFESNVALGDWNLSPITAVGQYYDTVHLGEDLLPTLGDRIIRTSIEIQISWSELRKQPYVARYAVGINGEPVAAIVCEYNRRKVFLTDINTAHPLFHSAEGNSVIEEVLTDVECPMPNGDSRYPIQHMQDALPDWGEGLAIDVLPGTEWQVLSSDETGTVLDLSPIAPGSEGFVALFSYLLVSTGERLKDELSSFVYLGPLRQVPNRDYLRPNAFDKERWGSGLAAWDTLYAWEDEKEDLKPRGQKSSELVDEVGKWLSAPDLLGLGYSFRRQEYKELPTDSPLALALRTDRIQDYDDLKRAYGELPTRRRLSLITETGLEVKPQDVGVGISQLVPVVVLAVGSGPWSFAAVEQPELHLHPAIQVRLGDLFIHTCTKENRQILIETHSEHLLLRLLRRIRETHEGELPPGHPGLTPAQLSVVFIEPSRSPDGVESVGTQVKALRVDVTGEFEDQWPHGFFEERAEELFGQ